MSIHRIAFLSSEHPPLDTRVFEKEAVSLAAAHFEVIHVAPGYRGAEYEHGVRLVGYEKCARWRRLPRLFRLARELDADVYHCNEIDSWLVGLMLKTLHGKKVVFDVHEHYSSRFGERFFPKPLHGIAESFMRAALWLLSLPTERLVLAKRSVTDEFWGNKDKQVLVQNFAKLPSSGDSAETNGSRPASSEGDPVTAIHIGAFGRARGWPQLLEALRRVKSRNLRLDVIGRFTDESEPEFLREVGKYGLSERVLVEPWMRLADVHGRIEAADIGLVLFQPGIANHKYALPHKMFDYMLAGLPLIVPDFAEEVAAIVQESDCGLLVDSSNPEAIANALDKLAGDKDLRERLGSNGRRAVIQRYNWDAEASKLVDMYRRMDG